MPAIVVPFRGYGPKLRLTPVSAAARGELALAMLADVLSACSAVAPTALVTEDEVARGIAAEFGVGVLADPGGGQGVAVGTALERVAIDPTLVVNADLPCICPDDLRTLHEAIPPGGMALVPAPDGTTNALGLAATTLFAPCYGPGSARRFRARAAELGCPVVTVTLPNLRDDVDTLEDLRALEVRVGPRTRSALRLHGLAA